MAARALTVVCAWCHRIVAVAPENEAVSHTICESCFDWTLTHESDAAGSDAIEFPPRDRPELGIWNLEVGIGSKN